ncbi:MAG: hypothetical protein ACYDER_03135 [Ktedonobacteraceae bacterium]
MIDDMGELFNTIPGVDETLAETIDFKHCIDTANWRTPGQHYQHMSQVTHQQVDLVVQSDIRMRAELRQHYLPALQNAGSIDIRRRDDGLMKLLQEKRLYRGRVFAADGTLVRYETLSLVGAQIAVSRVGYQGSTGQFVSNIVHWGQEVGRSIKLDELVQAMRSRGKHLAQKVNKMVLQTIMEYKEREILLELGPDIFKLIQGPLFPYEMLAGGGQANTLKVCLDLLSKLIDDGAYATIVSASTNRDLMLFGMALEPGEYAVIRDGKTLLDAFAQNAHYTDVVVDEYGGQSEITLFAKFIKKYGSKVVEGVLRSHHMSRPYVFYCNKERLDEAAHMLLADAAHTGPRGFPLLIDLADHYCSGSFKASEYTAYMNAEFARASGGSVMYASERSTRD